MKQLPYIIFCENPLESNKVDFEYQDEFDAALQNGFEILMFNFDDLVRGEILQATRRIKKSDQLVEVIYRGWMLSIKDYASLYNNLLEKGYRLINSVAEYQNCHYLPKSLEFIQDLTPRTVFESYRGENNIDSVIEKSSIFGSKPVVVKDYVKSEKHNWETACFVPDASNIEKLRLTILNMLKLRGDFLNEGIVIREFVELNHLSVHSKSKMPLAEEYRLFFFLNTLLDIYDYWEEGEYSISKPNTSLFENKAKSVISKFFSMDIARCKDGSYIIIELGDGQVAGLPDKTNRYDFYSKLKGFYHKNND